MYFWNSGMVIWFNIIQFNLIVYKRKLRAGSTWRSKMKQWVGNWIKLNLIQFKRKLRSGNVLGDVHETVGWSTMDGCWRPPRGSSPAELLKTNLNGQMNFLIADSWPAERPKTQVNFLTRMLLGVYDILVEKLSRADISAFLKLLANLSILKKVKFWNYQKIIDIGKYIKF